jgi:hypothetical protein
MGASPILSCINRVSDSTTGFEDEVYDGLWSGPGFKKTIQDHMAMIEKFPHRVQKSRQKEFDFPFDPEK